MSVLPERVVFVHAHPDDETLSTGATIATLADAGANVTVVTCTRGELGEVIPPALQHLQGAALGEHRLGELAAALSALGVTDHRVLGQPNARWEGRPARTYLDSGMQWGPRGARALDSTDARSLSAADSGEVAADIAAVLLDVKPHVVVSYARDGGYGHPDHVRAHEATRAAAEALGVPFYVVDSEGTPRGPVAVDSEPVLGRKRRALEAYTTQMTVTGDTYALSSGGPQPIAAVESFTRVRSVRSGFGDSGWGPRIATFAIATLLGVFSGALLTAAHQATVSVGAVVVPWGIIAALVITTALLLGLRLVFESRSVALVAGVGLLAASAILAVQSSGGSVLIPDNITGYVWTFAPALIGTVVLAWPKIRAAPAKDTIESSASKGSDPT